MPAAPDGVARRSAGPNRRRPNHPFASNAFTFLAQCRVLLADSPGTPRETTMKKFAYFLAAQSYCRSLILCLANAALAFGEGLARADFVTVDLNDPNKATLRD